MDRRKFFSTASMLAVGGVALLSVAGGAHAEKPAVYTGPVPGVGVGGYDVVAYFNAHKAVEGDPAITSKSGGVTYRFTSTEHRDAFAAAPAKYLPQYGGYCAFAVSRGYTAEIDPEAFSIVKGKLYLNYSKSVRAEWSQEEAANISKANHNWPNVLK